MAPATCGRSSARRASTIPTPTALQVLDSQNPVVAVLAVAGGRQVLAVTKRVLVAAADAAADHPVPGSDQRERTDHRDRNARAGRPGVGAVAGPYEVRWLAAIRGAESKN